MPIRDPERARQYQREYRRLRRAGDPCTTPGTSTVPLTYRLQTAADVLDLVAEQVQQVRADAEAGTLDKARCLGYLATVALKAIEAGNMAARIENLESVLQQRTQRARA